MDRKKVLQKFLTKEMRGIEIGALHSPTVPKSEGWSVVSVDHDTTEGLLQFYKDDTLVTRESLQTVDVVWNGGKLSAAVSKYGHDLGSFDYLVASHVVEHFPDLLGTLQDFEAVLKPDSVLSLAVPDLRYSFDFFMPMTSTAEILAAHHEKRTRHSKASLFRMAAYSVREIASKGIPNEFVNASRVQLLSDLPHAYERFLSHDASDEAEYVDNHTWYFTPSSFELIMLELRLLDLIHFDMLASERGPWGEFLVSMRKGNVLTEAEKRTLSNRRLPLLKRTVHELAERSRMLDSRIHASEINDPHPVESIAKGALFDDR